MINGNDLLAMGFTEGKILGMALKIAKTAHPNYNQEQLTTMFQSILETPKQYLQNPMLKKLAAALVEAASTPKDETIALLDDAMDYTIFGAENIEKGAIDQMNLAMRLPVSIAGALMPDAHQGYGLPIGGVLATRNAIIPYGVGVDIGCRMALSIFDISETHFLENAAFYKKILLEHTRFGAGNGFEAGKRVEHAVLDRPEFKLTNFIYELKDRAYHQLGSSGSGNHFVEWGIIEFATRDAVLGIDQGKYLALLTHSGSRGMGAMIAGHYTKLAKSLCKLPPAAANLAYLDLNSEAGQEYWLAMNLAGDYASACHEVIHQKMATSTGATLLAKVENHHNFAWKEILNGEELIVHRKGATPASKDVMGIIPGSMTAPGFLVRGLGKTEAVNSASHGAGRQMSRTQAIKNIKKTEFKAILKNMGVTLIGAGLDEAPMAYKDIRKVMAAQEDLVSTVATFFPKMVRMADDGKRED
jgi:tRNA-splicing ligase RtcB